MFWRHIDFHGCCSILQRDSYSHACSAARATDENMLMAAPVPSCQIGAPRKKPSCLAQVGAGPAKTQEICNPSLVCWPPEMPNKTQSLVHRPPQHANKKRNPQREAETQKNKKIHSPPEALKMQKMQESCSFSHCFCFWRAPPDCFFFLRLRGWGRPGLRFRVWGGLGDCVFFAFGGWARLNLPHTLFRAG